MKIFRLASVAAALLLPLAAFAAPPQPQFSAERFKAHVGFLADDLLEGRESGTRGHELAARYVAGELAQMGVQPGGENHSWFQQVPLAETSASGPAATLVITASSGEHTFAQGAGVTVRGVAGGGQTDLTAPAVFAGYGAADPEAGLDDYKGVDARGKVVVLIRGAPPGLASEVAAHLRADQTRSAAAHGAVAVITVASRAPTPAGNITVRTAIAPAPVFTNWVDPDGVARTGVTLLKANVTAEAEPAALLFQGAPRGLDEVQADIAAGGRPAGFALAATVRIQAATTARRYSSPEVIGLIPGADPLLRDEYVVLMAHLDHLGVRKGDGPGDRIYNGALDNGAGVATLLEVARAFGDASRRPRRSILVIANTGEEKGLLGADYFAHHPTVPKDKIVAVIDMDMPVLTYAFTDVVAYGGAHSTLDKSIAKAAGAMHVFLSPDFMPEQAVFVRSDHYPLARAGVPAVMLATGPSNGGEAAWRKYFAENYHRPSDDMSLPILWDQGARFAELNYRVVRELADQKDRPAWYAGDFFGDLFAPNQVKAKR